MRAATVREFGDADVLRLDTLPVPSVGPGQIRVRVRVAGVQHFDVRVREGRFPRDLTGPLPIVPGNEFAGTVEEVAADVTDLRIGDEVLGFSTLGAYAEHIVVPADQVVRKPTDMDWGIAGGFSGHAQGARNAVDQMRVASGDTVLINSAAGGLGTIAVQLARIRGAGTIVGTAGPHNHDYLRGLGALPVSYGPGLTERLRSVAPGGFDAALGFEPDGLRAGMALVHDPARVVTMVFSERIAALGVRDWTGTRSRDGLTEMIGHYERGDLTVHIRARHRLEEAAQAHRELETGHGRGKVVILVES